MQPLGVRFRSCNHGREFSLYQSLSFELTTLVCHGTEMSRHPKSHRRFNEAGDLPQAPLAEWNDP